MSEAIHQVVLEEAQGYPVKRERRRLIGDWLAFQALRFVVFLHQRTRLIEVGLRRPRKSALGEINLSEKLKLEGWQVAKDRSGYCYAFLQEAQPAQDPGSPIERWGE